MAVTPTPVNDDSVLIAEGLERHFKEGGRELQVLRGVELSVKRGEWVCILGRSGSGKSTLLHLLGGLDRPTRGTVQFEGQQLDGASGSALNAYRRNHVGLVFQSYHLLPELSAMENVLVGAMLRWSVWQWPGQRGALRQRARTLLGEMGLGDRLRHKPGQLSGGERQRVAIARALINQPTLLLADEPTGNLDAETSASILEVFRELHRGGQTLVMVTHDATVAEEADRRVQLKLGLVETAAS